MLEIATSINLLLTTYKTIKDLYSKAEYLELKDHILNMHEQLLELKEASQDLKDENISLKEEIKRLVDFSDRGLVMKDMVYYDKNNVGPYCPTCYDNERFLSLMCRPLDSFPPACPKCKYSLNR